MFQPWTDGSSTSHCHHVRGSATQTDPVLSKVYHFIKDGWPSSGTKGSDDLSPYHRQANELTVEGNCILWGTRVVVPVLKQGTL